MAVIGPEIRRSAEISDCGKYRWWLRRSWDSGNGLGLFEVPDRLLAGAKFVEPTHV